jgi:hypothetical protein
MLTWCKDNAIKCRWMKVRGLVNTSKNAGLDAELHRSACASEIGIADIFDA